MAPNTGTRRTDSVIRLRAVALLYLMRFMSNMTMPQTRINKTNGEKRFKIRFFTILQK